MIFFVLWGDGWELVIYFLLDDYLVQLLIVVFQVSYFDVCVVYENLLMGELYDCIVVEIVVGIGMVDFVFFLVMDLQVKLVNDGYVCLVVMFDMFGWFDWVNWCDIVYVLIFEFVVFVYYKFSFVGQILFVICVDLICWMVEYFDQVWGCIGIYDVVCLGVGYLFLVCDQEFYFGIWLVVVVMGCVDVQ